LGLVATGGARVRGVSRQPANPNTTAAAKKPKVHLDVGFTDFQKNLSAQVADQVKKAAIEAHWTSAEGDALAANVTKALADGMSVALKPLKVSIGKTWMALPQDAQKESFVAQLKNAFIPVFASSARTTESHLRLNLHRIESTEPHDVAACSKTLINGLLAEHCYDTTVSSKATALAAKQMGKASKNASAIGATGKNASAVNATGKKRFCIQSVVDGLAHRLNDTTGLLSMSMRFEAGAMSLAQRAKAGAKKH